MEANDESMSLLSKLAGRIRSLEHCLAEPRQFGLRRRGVHLELYRQLNEDWLRSRRFATVLDVGANVGQFALAASAAWPNTRIYSFEPLPDCFEQLQVRLRRAADFTAINVGIGDKAGSLTFERNSFHPSSSFLKTTPLLRSEFPHAGDSKSITVQVKRLDDLAGELVLRPPMLVKIDVQGYEDKVLTGGAETIQRADVIIIESSFVRLYEGQPLFWDIYRTLTAWGFFYRGSLEQLTSTTDGRPLQADSIFVKDS
jgi:FkbM family methyltransferase